MMRSLLCGSTIRLLKNQMRPSSSRKGEVLKGDWKGKERRQNGHDGGGREGEFERQVPLLIFLTSRTSVNVEYLDLEL